MLPEDFSVLPCHVGVIMDGNGRWAKKRGLPRSAGHKEGANNFRTIGEYAGDLGIKHISFYAFSTENWIRPQAEVDALMELFYEYLDESKQRLEESIEKGIRLRFLGDRSVLAPELVALMDFMEDATKEMQKINLNIAINYGGQQEILSSVRKIGQKIKDGVMSPDDITLNDIQMGLWTAEQPPVDLMIRPSGEQRLSNFLLWQSAYAEFWYSDVLWPDFSTDDFDAALKAYEKRNRRFGGVK